MKSSKKTGKSATKSQKESEASMKGRKMEPVKSKELKNRRFDDLDDEEEVDPEIIDENFKGFDDFYDASEEEDD